jgi:hypothetical protein
MKKLRTTTSRKLAVVIAVGTAVFAALGTAALTSPAASGADTFTIAEQQATLKVFSDGYRLRAQAARDFDVSKFAGLYIDDPDVPLTLLQQSTLERIAPGVPKSGLLTFQIEFYKYWSAGNVAAQRVKAAEDARVLPDPADVAAAIPARDDPIVMPQLTLKSAEITTTRAVIVVDSEPALFTVTLIKHGDRWFIAGEDRAPHE